MVLTAHVDAGFNNDTKSCSRTGGHLFLLELDACPCWDGLVVVIVTIMYNGMPMAVEAELGIIYKCTHAMVLMWQALTKMG